MISNRLWKILVTFKSCKTLSATAERLFVSQPSISSSMKMLEKELGVQLFDRSKNKIVLNEVGRPRSSPRTTSSVRILWCAKFRKRRGRCGR